MEAAALYTRREIPCADIKLMTVSDHLITGEETTAAERQSTFMK
ncbi:purine nucleoside phosphorylase [Enterococcus faecium]|nr:purine nucleoside phosphorylase [Enterococcus faecium]